MDEERIFVFEKSELHTIQIHNQIVVEFLLRFELDKNEFILLIFNFFNDFGSSTSDVTYKCIN